MSSFLSILFCFCFVFPLISLPSPASSASSLIQTTCNQTSNYDFCVEKLQSDPDSTNASDVSTLSRVTLKLAIVSAKSAAQYADELFWNSSVRSLLWKCADKFRNTGKALTRAVQALAEMDYDYTSVHLSVARAYAGTCGPSFERASPPLPYPEEMAKKEDELSRFCTTASEIISQLL